MRLYAAAGTDPTDVTAFVAPLGEGRQLTVIEAIFDQAAGTVVIPFPAPLIKCEALSSPGFMDTLRHVFPSTIKIAETGSPPPKRQRTASDHRSTSAAPLAPVMACAAYSPADVAALVKDDSLLAEYPAHGFAVCTPTSASTAGDAADSKLHCRLLAVHAMPSSHQLWVPLKRRGTAAGAAAVAASTAPGYGTGAATYFVGGSGLTIFSLGTARHSDWRGGGKTPDEMFHDLHKRLAIGSFKRLEPAALHWEDVRCGVHAPAAAATASGGGDHATCACGAAALAPTSSTHTGHAAASFNLPAELVDLFAASAPAGGTSAACSGGASSSTAGAAAATAAPDAGAAVASTAPVTDHPHHVRFSPATSSTASPATAAAGPAVAAVGTPATKTLPRGMPWLDAIRMRKAPAAPDMDVLLQLDDGTGSADDE